MNDIRVGGIVLCGGESRRMGRAKAWLPFGDETMLQRVVRLLTENVHPLVVVAAPGQELPTIPTEVTVVRDTHIGPGATQCGELRRCGDAELRLAKEHEDRVAGTFAH